MGTTKNRCCTLFVAKATACMSRFRRWIKARTARTGRQPPSTHGIDLKRTTAFRLSMTYAILFCLLTLLALFLVYQHILEEVSKQIDAGLKAEVHSLAMAANTLTQTQLADLIAARSTLH